MIIFLIFSSSNILTSRVKLELPFASSYHNVTIISSLISVLKLFKLDIFILLIFSPVSKFSELFKLTEILGFNNLSISSIRSGVFM